MARGSREKRVENRRTAAAGGFAAGLSITLKIVLFTASCYVFVVSLYLIASWAGVVHLPKAPLGIQAKWWLGIVQILVISAAATIATKLFLTDRIEEIKGFITKIGTRNFSRRIAVDKGDELAEIAASLNEMASRIGRLYDDKMRAIKNTAGAKGDGYDKKRLEALVKDFSILYEIGQHVNSTIEISELYRTLIEVLPKRIDLHKFAILMVDDKKEFLNVEAAYGFENTERIYDLAFRIGEGISGEAALKGEIIYLPNVSADKRFLHYRGESIEQGSFISIPLRLKSDILGVMNCSRSQKDAFSQEDIRLLTLVANQIALAAQNAKLYTKTRELSVRDELTGLYNRRHFQGVLQMEWKRATRFKRPLSLLMVDIDHFKEFNDTLGHRHGDKVLKLISELISKNLREVDTVARFGGEEFVVLLPDTDREGAVVVGEKLRRIVQTEHFEEDHRHILPLTISVGISVFPDDAKEMDDLIDHADIALYEAKDGGRNRVIVYATPEELSQDLEGLPFMTN